MKTPFVNLKHIDASIIDHKYNFIIYKEKNKNEKKNTLAKTKIADITKDNLKSSYFSYIDEAKNDHICILTMKDVILNKELPTKTDINCFWCRHSFPFRPIGCPVTFKNTRLYKKYYSEITNALRFSKVAVYVSHCKNQFTGNQCLYGLLRIFYDY